MASAATAVRTAAHPTPREIVAAALEDPGVKETFHRGTRNARVKKHATVTQGRAEAPGRANTDKQSGIMIKNNMRRLRVDIFKIVLRATTAGDDGLTQYEIELTPEQLEVLAYLDGFNVNYIANSEFAYLNLPLHLREIHDTAKGICNTAFLPNARMTLHECLVGVIALLWENADTLAGLPQEERQGYVLDLTRKASNKAIRRPKELQLPEHTSDADISVPSCTRNPLELDRELPTYGRRVYHSKPEGVSHIQGRPDWVLAHQYENFLIADIDSRRAAAAMPEPESEFERCERLLGANDADWYWTVRANRDLLPQRHPKRPTLTAAERKRYQRLKQQLASCCHN